MSAADGYRAVVARLRNWGFDITEASGCYSRSNGLGWARGVPVGHINHHYVCSLNPSQSYIDSLVQGLMNGKTVNWFADVNGRGYLIGAGPMNHAGQGNSSVLARTTADQPPPGPADAAGDMTGNTFYSGTELQHPGDSTPYPQAMVDVMVAISAAEAMQWGWSSARVIDHFEWTGRKIDMSLWGGRVDGSGARKRTAIAERMTPQQSDRPGGADPADWFDMATEQQIDAKFAALGKYLDSQIQARTDAAVNRIKGEIINDLLAASFVKGRPAIGPTMQLVADRHETIWKDATAARKAAEAALAAVKALPKD